MLVSYASGKEYISHSWMLVCKGIVYRHIMEVWLYVMLEEGFNLLKSEIRVHKNRSQISFNHVWQTLIGMSAAVYARDECFSTLGGSWVSVQ